MLKDNKYLAILVFSLLAACVISLHFGLIQKPQSGRSYKNTTINGIIDTIYYYDKSYPVVSIHDERIILEVPTGCSQYLLARDSIRKESGRYGLTSYRDKGRFIECIVWGYPEEGANAKPNGFVSKSNLKKKRKI